MTKRTFIKALRAMAITDQMAADRLGVARQTIELWKQGKNIPHSADWRRLWGALGL